MKFEFSRAMLMVVVCAAASCKSRTETLFELLPPAETGVEFSNEIHESDTFNILTYEYIYNGGGVGIADFNNDGLRDIFFAGNQVANRLYLNRGGFKFNDITDVANVNVPGRWNSGVSVVDINNDGWMDVYVTATMRANSGDRLNMMFVNQGLNAEGIPTFVDEAGKMGIQDGGYCEMAAFFDYDRDGDLDLYVLINQRMPQVPTSYRPRITDGSALNNDHLYRNNGDLTFSNVTKEAGILIEGFGLGLAVSDLNKDGYPDLYVSNDYLSNDILYINNGNGTFTNRISEYIGHQSQFSMGNDVADINNDGLSDIVTTDMLPETHFRKKTTIGNKSYATYIYNENFGYEYQYIRNMVHLNNGLQQGLPFSEIGQLAGVYQTEWSWSPLFVDVDNDGFKDLMVTNGFPKDVTDKDFSNYRADVGNLASPGFLNDSIPVVKVPNYAFRNGGNLLFEDATAIWGLGHKSFSNGAAFADLDNDGDIDYVTNNINDQAFVYENHLYEAGSDLKGKNAFIDLRLRPGSGNQTIGTKVTLFNESGIQYQECSVYRGFLSSVDDVIHFGLGTSTNVDSVIIEWPDGKIQALRQPEANRMHLVSYEPERSSPSTLPREPKLVNEVSKDIGIVFSHSETDFIDFNQQRTLPHKLSQSGPGIAVGDVNGDKLEDFVVGGSTGSDYTIFVQGRDGKFKPSPLPKHEKRSEDEGLLLFDADGDHDLDLYVVSGGVEGNAPQDYQDRLLINDGRGNFKERPDALPATEASGSCVRAADFDKDGDLDLFVGGRIVPGAYPMPAKSYILRNEGGRFTDVSQEVSSGLDSLGMIVDAIWTDFDNDGDRDLLVAGEFMPLVFLRNNDGRFDRLDNSGLDGKKGWWNSLGQGDFDKDGDIDYVAGNLGWNNNFQVSSSYPLKVFAKDFDGNGSIDPVMACFMRESMDDTVRRLFPIHFWDEMNSQSPAFRRKFTRYKQFGGTKLEGLLTPTDLKGALVLEANYLGTSYVENLGGGKFEIKTLPVRAQFAPVNGIVADDIDRDGNLDLLLIGNDFGNEVFAGRYDAFIGEVLRGKGDGTFESVSPTQSGFEVTGDAKSLVRISTPKSGLYLASRNKGPLVAFKPAVEGIHFAPGPMDSWAEIDTGGGKTMRIEFQYGSGFLSQSSRAAFIPPNATSITVFDSKGISRVVKLPLEM